MDNSRLHAASRHSPDRRFQIDLEKVAAVLLAEEPWVLGLSASATKGLASQGAVTDRVRMLYLGEYAKQWEDLLADIRSFVENWLPCFIRDHRAYLTVAIGCTGGQHRSVYLVETLARQFASHGHVLKRHRELDAR